MPDHRKHRGPGPQDQLWFGDTTHAVLRSAVADLSWLFTRGYAAPSSLKLVGDRYALVERQRMAVLRASCSDTHLALRVGRQIEPSQLRNHPLAIDGFNLILTLESALGGGMIIGCRDGCFRDLASVHGSYRRVSETQPALTLAAEWLTRWQIGPCTWYLDSPVSNSGRLAAMVRATHSDWQVEVVPNPDTVLKADRGNIATADAGILDVCGHWLNLARSIIESAVPEARVIDLGPRDC